MSLEALSKRALDLISSIPGGILQSELRKMLQVESSKCSRIVTRLESSGQIRRQKASLNGARTYLLKPASAAKPKSKLIKPAQTEILIHQQREPAGDCGQI
jgi:DNA-binding MarR family transcriptional regulator